MVRLDVAFIFEQIGGPKALLEALEQEWPGSGLKYPTVQMWQQRQNISTAWQVPVLYLMIKRLALPPLVCMTDDEELGRPAG